MPAIVRSGRTGVVIQRDPCGHPVQGQSGKLASARIYDDTDPPLGAAT
jgi:hypothetical protein